MKQTITYDAADIEKLVKADAISRMGLVPGAVVVVSLNASVDVGDRGTPSTEITAGVTFDPAAQAKPPDATQSTATLKCPSPHSKDGKCERVPVSPGAMAFHCKNCGRL